MSLRAIIYTRVSADKSGQGRSPKEQEADARLELARRDLELVEVLCDNDRGASRFSVSDRPAFRRLLSLVEGGAVDVIVVWELSRLTRDPEVWAAFAGLCRKHGVAVIGGGRLYDLDDPDAAFEAGLSNLLAEREVGTTRKRTKRALAANLNTGHGISGRIQLGYRRVRDEAGRTIGQELDPATAPLVVSIFESIVAGESLQDIARRLNAAGSRLLNGQEWSGVRVRQQVYRRAGYLGHRMHKGAVARADAWPALVSAELYDAAHAVMTDRNHGRPTNVKHLLAGILACGACDGMIRVSRGRSGSEYHAYACGGPVSGVRVIGAPVGCVSRSQRRVDAAVAALVVARLSQPDALAALAPDTSGLLEGMLRERATLRQQLAAAEAAFVDLELSARGFGLLEAKLGPRLEALDLAIAAHDPGAPDVVEQLTRGDVAATWSALDLHRQREVLRWMLVEPRLMPANGRGGRCSDFVGLAFRWRGSAIAQEI